MGAWGTEGAANGCFAIGLMFPKPMRPFRFAAAAIAAAALLAPGFGMSFEELSAAEEAAEEEDGAAEVAVGVPAAD